MVRKVFYSFHYKPDNWRASQVRNIGKVEGNKAASDNDWETVTKGGDNAIKKWINDQMNGRSCAVVLIGKDTAGRKWINYEIEKAWEDGKGVLGIYIQDLKDSEGNQTTKGKNPFSGYKIGDTAMDQIVKTYDPPYSDSQEAYGWIEDNIEDWIEAAIKIREKY
ncbi:MAG: TIR domain-containing protein [Acidobacteria bacterium]|nr:TIR domain-containing protein [Acidobacteriota bacterium]